MFRSDKFEAFGLRIEMITQKKRVNRKVSLLIGDTRKISVSSPQLNVVGNHLK